MVLLTPSSVHPLVNAVVIPLTWPHVGSENDFFNVPTTEQI